MIDGEHIADVGFAICRVGEAHTAEGVMRLEPWSSYLTLHYADGSIRCQHNDQTECALAGHTTHILYRLVPSETGDEG
jgi:hypothetical protein